MKLPGNLGDIFAQVSQLQQGFRDAKAQLEQKEFETSVGGGAVTIRMTGLQTVKSVTIVPAVLESKDCAMLQDLVLAAMNEAIRTSQAMMKEEFGKLTGGLPIPGMFG